MDDHVNALFNLVHFIIKLTWMQDCIIHH